MGPHRGIGWAGNRGGLPAQQQPAQIVSQVGDLLRLTGPQQIVRTHTPYGRIGGQMFTQHPRTPDCQPARPQQAEVDAVVALEVGFERLAPLGQEVGEAGEFPSACEIASTIS